MADLMPTLRSALLELLFDLRHDDLPLIIGGGYGLYLKREQVRQQGRRTLLSEWPEARATNDLDLFLRPELLLNPLQLKTLALLVERPCGGCPTGFVWRVVPCLAIVSSFVVVMAAGLGCFSTKGQTRATLLSEEEDTDYPGRR